ncbi:recombination protein NinG [Bacteroides sp.]|uniref:recombination protein NinG n=1 Tax=Bacteroides sp. TaxID=29523 RepID=UPI003AB399EC
MPKSSLKTRLDTVFAMFIRLRDAMPNGMFRCISCGRLLPFDQSDCGHYINRQHMATRFNEKNCNAQCRKCNRFDEGNIQGYRRGLIAKYGEPTVLMLEAMKNQINKISDFEYRTMIDYYRKEVKRLKKEKQIK